MSSDEWEDDVPVVVIDNGSSTCKAGFAGDKTVTCRIPTAIGTPIPGVECSDDGTIGEYVSPDRKDLTLNYPIEKGVITNFDDMEEIWKHIIYKELLVKEEFSILLTEHPSNPKRNREKTAEIMFEKFNALSVNIALQHELALMASGRTNGVIIDSGEGQTSVICIVDGLGKRDSFVHLDVGGRDLTEYLTRSLKSTEGLLPSDIRNIKHGHCYIAMEYEDEMKRCTDSRNLHQTYTSSELGKDIAIGHERIQCPEILFRPSIADKHFAGIHHAVNDSILKCPLDIQEEMYSNIIFSGGNTIFRNISKRMEKDMCTLLQSDRKIKVFAPPERLKSVWLGGSIMGSVDMFRDKFITKEQYNETGPSLF